MDTVERSKGVLMPTDEELDEAATKTVERLNRLMFKVGVVEIGDLGRITAQRQKEHLRALEVMWRQRLEQVDSITTLDPAPEKPGPE